MRSQFREKDTTGTFLKIYRKDWHGDIFVVAVSFEFSLSVFTEFTEFSDKNICHYNKRARTCPPDTSCVRDQDATTAPPRHMWETGSLNWAQFMLQWFIRFPEIAEFSEFLFHLGKTQLKLTFNKNNAFYLESCKNFNRSWKC